MKVKKAKRVRMDEIGLFLRTIEMDYNPKNDQEMAELISENFNVTCLVEDIEHYRELFENEKFLEEDWELESNRDQYFRQIGQSNPFY